jgi:hypothetical protein
MRREKKLLEENERDGCRRRSRDGNDKSERKRSESGMREENDRRRAKNVGRGGRHGGGPERYRENPETI